MIVWAVPCSSTSQEPQIQLSHLGAFCGLVQIMCQLSDALGGPRELALCAGNSSSSRRLALSGWRDLTRAGEVICSKQSKALVHTVMQEHAHRHGSSCTRKRQQCTQSVRSRHMTASSSYHASGCQGRVQLLLYFWCCMETRQPAAAACAQSAREHVVL